MKTETLDIKNHAPGRCKSDLRLSIVVPAYNENENLADAIREISAGIPASVADYEIIIIDDGSRDATADIVRGFTASDSKIHAIFHDRNRGKGAALNSGFKNARMEWVLFTDADLQIDISELEAFLPYTGSYDIITGFRQGRRDPLSRKLFSKIFSGIIRLSLGFGINDLNCPFKLIRKSFLDSCDLQSKGFFIDTELIYHACRKQARIKELGVSCQPRLKGESTVRFRHVIETVRELISLLCRK